MSHNPSKVVTASGKSLTVSNTLTLTGTDGSSVNFGTGGTVAYGTVPSLPVSAANGGTGQSSYTTGDLLYASGATALSKLADVATGSVLISGGVGVAPSWSTAPTVTQLLGPGGGTTMTINNSSGAVDLKSGGVSYWLINDSGNPNAIALGANKSLVGIAGTGAINFGSMTGDWSLPTGAGTYLGASGKALSLQTTGANITLRSTTSGTVLVDSAAALNIGTSAATSMTLGRSGISMTMNNFIMASGADITTNAGASDFDFSLSTGAFWFPTGNIVWNGASNKTISLTSSGASGQISLTAGSSGAITLNAGGVLSLIGYSSVNLQYGGTSALTVGSSSVLCQSGFVLQTNGGAKILGTAPAAAADAVSFGAADINGAGTGALKNIYEGGAVKVERVEGSTGSLNVMYIARNFADDEKLTLPVPTNVGVLDIFSVDNASQGCVVILSDGTVNSTPLSGIMFSTSDTDTMLCVYDGGADAVLKNRLGATKFLIGTYRWN